MNNKRLNIQMFSIFAIIFTAFIGSAMLFSYLNTDSIKRSVETETGFSAMILASSIRDDLEHMGIPAQDADQSSASDKGADSAILTEDPNSTPQLSEGLKKKLTEVVSHANTDEGEYIDLWLVDASGNILYENMAKDGRAFDSLLSDANWRRLLENMSEESDVQKAICSVWIGEQSLFMLNQQLLLVTPILEKQLYLVMCNRCVSTHAIQRQQFTLFAGVMTILMIAMVIILANTLFSYRKQIIRLATTDELTGLANRKSFNEAYADFINNTGRGAQENFSVFLIDIDFFKQINDTYGHAAGDLALRTLAGHIGHIAQECDGFAGRWGGDEFIGVLPVSQEAAGRAILELRENLASEHLEGGFKITISVGVAQARRADSPVLAHLTELADQALYVSKENGRNRTTFYTKELGAAAEAPEQEKLQSAAAGVVSSPDKENKDSVAATDVKEIFSNLQDASGRRTLGRRLKAFLQEKLVKSILLGVKWMAPFVAGGGLLIGLAFLFDASSVDLAALSVLERTRLGSITPLAASLKAIGDNTFNFMLPVFAGFMAYGLAGENAFLAGFVGGFMTISSNTGFIGAMIAGLMAGLIASENSQFIGRMPKFIQKAAPIVIFPVFNLLLMYAIVSLLITPAAAFLGNIISQMLDALSTLNTGFTGAVAGGMMAVDMGGIVNKAAYNYGVNGLSFGQTGFMASVMAGGMVPPIGIALSIVLFKDKYTADEKDRAASTLFMGLSFITEGALPFVFSDVPRVIPACIAGSAVAGLLSELFGCQLPAPHGGIFVLPLMTNPLLYLISLATGSLVTAVLLGWLKKTKKAEDQ